ncbi:CAP domain-containing protein [Paracoccus ravus]|uniref:CAP domain-containing protein n=1 Tax=Paracoccus ravus TaxID=2447760 RepID=UPI00106F0398|nr:CAP domain-containing protein [Paracoccus ravus]
MTRYMIAAMLLALAACSPAEQPPEVSTVVSSKSAMPRGILRTDGHGPVLVSVAGTALCGSVSAAEAKIALNHSNAVRAAAALPPLRLDARLTKAAEQQACDMASRGVMEHRGRASAGPAMRIKQLGYKPKITAENIAAGATSLFDLEGALRQWEASGAHRQNTNIPQMEEMGIGRALSPDGRVAYWSVVYSDPK